MQSGFAFGYFYDGVLKQDDGLILLIVLLVQPPGIGTLSIENLQSRFISLAYLTHPECAPLFDPL
jgi:hypothetical protein